MIGVVNAYQCSNCDLHLAGNNLTRGHNMGKLPELVWLTRELLVV